MVVVGGYKILAPKSRSIDLCAYIGLSKIAWSAQNCVACITGDEERVTIRTLYRRAKDCEWILSNRVPLKIPQLNEEFQPVNISWSPLGSDLAISDVFGRILIFNLGYAQGKMQFRGSSSLDKIDEAGVIVGMRWLPIFSLQQRVTH